MKIRTDFVTNSSSSSFVSVSIWTQGGKNFNGGFESGENEINMWEEPFELSAEEFEALTSGEQLIKKALAWFSSTMADPDIPPEEFGDNIDAAKELKREDFSRITIESAIECDDFCNGLEISYDYESKELERAEKE